MVSCTESNKCKEKDNRISEEITIEWKSNGQKNLKRTLCIHHRNNSDAKSYKISRKTPRHSGLINSFEFIASSSTSKLNSPSAT